MKAMVLCAGYGTRLGGLTREVPKPMLDVGGTPLLTHILGQLARHGFTEVGINLHFLPERIRGTFGDGAGQGLSITYAEEPRLLGTAGGVKNMAGFLKDGGPFLVHYGDIVTDQDLTAMVRYHRESGALATLLLHQRAGSNSVVTLAVDGRVTAFWERPRETPAGVSGQPWVFSGLCMCEPEFLDEIPAGMVCDLPRDVFPRLAREGRLAGFPLAGYRCAVDSPERLGEVRRALSEGLCQSTWRS